MQGQDKVCDPPMDLYYCVDKSSCKHLCCRTGLEKPPKAGKKRAPATQKSDGLSQLTLKATVTKKDTEKNARKGKEKPTAKEDSSERYHSSPLRGQEELKQKPSMATGGSKYATPSSSKQKAFHAPSKMPSSDYSEDEFSDFPSPSELLKDTTSEFKQPPSIDVPETGQKTKSFVDLTTPSGDHYPDTAESIENLTGEIQPTPFLENDRTVGVWEDPTSSPKNNTFSSPENIKSSATAMPLTELSRNTIPKRKASSLDETKNERSRKRTEWCSINASPAVEPNEQQQQTVSEGSPGWEDVDRLLLEEFKDVINFY